MASAFEALATGHITAAQYVQAVREETDRLIRERRLLPLRPRARE